MLSIPVDIAAAAGRHPNGPEVWAALLAEFAAELQQAERNLSAPKAHTSADPAAPCIAGETATGCPAFRPDEEPSG